MTQEKLTLCGDLVVLETLIVVRLIDFVRCELFQPLLEDKDVRVLPVPALVLLISPELNQTEEG